ncbi:4864_t:CDS:2 [Paraglomus occultum]|uniref:4864_t:CDS:1 n=1 Tax=Paraglomus occultum TaxID=144539 RepID=A0A9N9GTH6_9GLOM|nr:4864_t:CDS:2 [Paraglomus occultum]
MYGQSKLNFQLLPSIILLFPLLVDALLPTNTDDEGLSDPTSESVFDLMATVLIASILTIDVDRIKRGRKAYKVTKDTFFIEYLITTLLSGILLYGFNAVMICCMRNIPVKYFELLPTFLTCTCMFGNDLTFGFLAVRRGYVNSWFVFGPVIVAFFIGVGIFMYVLKWELTSDHYVKEDEKLKKLFKVYQRKSRRATWIIGFCSQLMFCLIVAPSVLWIKFHLTLGFIAFTMEDISMKLQRRIEETEIIKNETENGTASANEKDVAIEIF